MTGNFFFDGVSAESLGVTSVRINSSDDVMPVFGGQTYMAQNVIEHDYQTFIRTTKDNLRLNMFFTLREDDVRGSAFTPERINSLGKFFARSIPVELMVEEDMTKVIKVVPTTSIEIVRFGRLRGYFQITFQATTPYWMSPMEILTFNLPANGSFNVINGRNIQDKHGNFDVYPRIVIRNIIVSNPNFILNNISSGKAVGFNGVLANDNIFMHHRIVNARLDQRIFHKWNKMPFYITEGNNVLNVNNSCVIDIHLQYPIF